MSRISFLHMDNLEVVSSLQLLFKRGEVEFIRSGMVPEADFYFCRWRGLNFDVRFDLIYGPDIRFSDPCTPEQQAELEALILATEA